MTIINSLVNILPDTSLYGLHTPYILLEACWSTFKVHLLPWPLPWGSSTTVVGALMLILVQGSLEAEGNEHPMGQPLINEV